MKPLKTILILAGFAIAGMGCASPSLPGPAGAGVMQQAANPAHPWDSASAVVAATEADLAKSGILGIRTHVADLEKALATANDAFEAAHMPGTTMYVLTDGQSETLAALLIAAGKGKSGGAQQVVAIANPYPKISFYLGSYYNETRRPADALRVLNAGLALPRAFPDGEFGEMRPALLSERGATFLSMKRWDEALATYDDALTLKTLKPKDRARMLRGRGSALTDLDRLDEAEQAYRDSLDSEPNNPLALNELRYIARLRAGGPHAPNQLLTPM